MIPPLRSPPRLDACAAPRLRTLVNWLAGCRPTVLFTPAVGIFLLLACLPESKAVDVTYQFAEGSAAWLTTTGWSLVESADGQVVFRGDASNDGFARNTAVTLQSSWRIEADLAFQRYYADNQGRGVASLALFPGLYSGVQLLANINHQTNDAVEIQAQWFDAPRALWMDSLLTAWQPSQTSRYRIQLTRPGGSDRITLVVSGPNGFTNRLQSTPIPSDVLNQMQVFGLRVNSARVAFDNVRVITPYELPAPPRITRQPLGSQVTVGSPILLVSEAEGATGLQFQWLRNGVRLPGATSNRFEVPKALLIHQGEYTVEVSNGETISLSEPALVTVIDARLSIAAPAPSRPVVTLFAVPGIPFRLEESTDLKRWTIILSGVGAGQSIEFTPAATASGHAWYRLVVP